jgi:hypothetical protein
VTGWWRSPINRDGGREWRTERSVWRKGGGGEKGNSSSRCAPFIAVQGGHQQHSSRNHGGQRRWCHGLEAGARFGNCRSDSGADRQAPHGLIFFHNFQN